MLTACCIRRKATILLPGSPWRNRLSKRQHGCGLMLVKRIWHERPISIYCLRDYNGALAELEVARRSLPNDPRLFELTGYILRRRGQQEEGLRNLERAVELDPRNFSTLQQIAFSYQILGRYAEAIAALDHALAIVPDNAETRALRSEYYVYWKGDTRPLHQTINAILAQGPSAIASAATSWFACALAERDPAAAERALVALGDNPCWGDSSIILSRALGKVCWRA